MLQFSRWSIAGAAFIATGLAAGAKIPLLPSTAAVPDTQNH